MIIVENLTKEYGEKLALRGIDFAVEKGEIFGLLGPNGAGKTTTIKILTGQLWPDGGQATIKNNDVIKERVQIKPLIGAVPEEGNLYYRLTVKQNLELFCRLYQSDFTNIDYFLGKVNLLAEKNVPVKDLSKGMKQRVLLVRAMLHRPEVLFLDEPTSGLDPSSADSIHQLLLDLNQEGITILLTSHNMEEVDKLCHRVAFLEKGLIVAMDSPENLKLKYNNNMMRVLLESDNSLEERVLELAGEQSASLLSKWVKEGKVKSIHSCEPTLADIFVKLTGREID